MATRNAIFQSFKSTFPAFFGFGILSFCANAPDAATVQFSHVLCVLSGELFKVLPAIMLAALQAFAAFAVDHAQFLAICHALACAWPLLHFVLQTA